MRENRTSGSEGGEAQTNELSLPLSLRQTGACKPAKSGSGLCAANRFNVKRETWNLFCRKLLLKKGFCGLFLATVRVERVY